jgi:ADP-ribose pyrophosphatase YjhB (NUDIX family)
MPPPERDRDLPPAAGPLARLHLWAGNALIRAAGLVRAPVTLGVRLVALDAAGRVFLVRHGYLPGWHLPGGGVEGGESAREAATREAREEGGLVLAGPPVLLGLYFHRTTGRNDHVAVFVARDVRREADAGGGLEIRAAGFFDPAAPPEGVTAATRARIAEALGTAPVGDRW